MIRWLCLTKNNKMYGSKVTLTPERPEYRHIWFISFMLRLCCFDGKKHCGQHSMYFWKNRQMSNLRLLPFLTALNKKKTTTLPPLFPVRNPTSSAVLALTFSSLTFPAAVGCWRDVTAVGHKDSGLHFMPRPECGTVEADCRSIKVITLIFLPFLLKTIGFLQVCDLLSDFQQMYLKVCTVPVGSPEHCGSHSACGGQVSVSTDTNIFPKNHFSNRQQSGISPPPCCGFCISSPVILQSAELDWTIDFLLLQPERLLISRSDSESARETDEQSCATAGTSQVICQPDV